MITVVILFIFSVEKKRQKIINNKQKNVRFFVFYYFFAQFEASCAQVDEGTHIINLPTI